MKDLNAMTVGSTEVLSAKKKPLSATQKALFSAQDDIGKAMDKLNKVKHPKAAALVKKLDKVYESIHDIVQFG